MFRQTEVRNLIFFNFFKKIFFGKSSFNDNTHNLQPKIYKKIYRVFLFISPSDTIVVGTLGKVSVKCFITTYELNSQDSLRC